MRIAKVPYSGGGLGWTKGCELGPDKVLAEMEEMFLTESGNIIEISVDAVKVDNGNVEETNKSIQMYIGQADEEIILIGGDHSITYPGFIAFSKQFRNPGLLVLDAHPDLMDPTASQTHEDYLRKLIDDGILRPENVVIAGIRNPFSSELEFIRRNKIKTFSSKSIYDLGMEEACNSIMESCRGFENLYLSIDIDILDPAFAPGTGHREPGGLSSRELIYLIQRISNLKNLRIADIVEVNPAIDVNDMTSRVAARIAFELIR